MNILHVFIVHLSSVFVIINGYERMNELQIVVDYSPLKTGGSPFHGKSDVRF